MSAPLQASKGRFVVGSHVWVEDPDEAWMDGLVEEINGDELVINCTSGKKSNPVLEAFGNAKTVRNNNSSRFGKFVEIQFDDNGKISGAAIRTYLLERSRVCQISDPERNYHCFYMLCAAPPEDCKKYKLGDARSFHYLNQSNCIALDGMDDSKEYMETRRAMGIVGISSDEQEAIFRVVAAILHLGNVEFAEGSEADSSVPKDENSQFHLKTAAELFMCDEKGLEESLCKRVMATRGESITKNLDPRAAALSRDALSRIVYSRLFDWLVNKINSSIGQDPDSKILIGVLDIYGFESFLTNSFEQFCINLTNEKLQQHFNQHVFKMEQEEYTKEEIDWSYIQFVDNQEILDLIEKKPGGIIALLDETCMLRNSTHETFAEKLYQKFKDNTHFSKPKFSRSDFTIHHYAGNVESTKSTKFTSIGSSFKQQLQSLLETLSATEPHYIRCIKPNNVLKPAIFENSDVLQQLRCGAAKETGALQAAKSKLEKEVEELTWRLQLEKRIRADMEEAKTQENKRLQLQLQELQLQLKDTKDLLKREHETAKEASEKVAAVPEVLADTARVNELTSENEKLKILVASFEEKLQKTEQKFEETEKAREELLNKATDAESKINEMMNTMQSLQEKLTNTEAENHVLRQQAMKARPDNMPLLNMHRKSNLANGSVHSDEQTPHGTPMEFGRRSLVERHSESVDTLINCVVENVGFSEGKPVAAITIYKCLLHWRIFETDKTNVFDRLIQIFGSAMQKQDNNADLAYWLSNSSSLLIILQKSLKPPGSSVTTPMKIPQTQTSFLGRMVFRASNITVDMDLVRQVEAKYPALLFKQQLTAFVEGLYGMIRDNVKREISSVLSLVIQAPRNAKAGLITDQGSYWQMIVNHLNDLLKVLQENCVPTIFARKIFTQIFSFINAQLLNSLLVRRECCSFSNGEYVKQGLDELESWCTQAKPEYAGSAWDELKHICQAVGFLVIFKKFRISYDEIINDLCPVLSVQQIYKICTQYWDDKYNTESVSEEVLDEMKKLVNEGAAAGQGARDNTFLLDEEISMPLSLEEIASSMEAKEFQNVSPPRELLENAAFQFLRS
ncbi:unnamed protein product [Urochloa decumbens]|uniref:Uncharacterized protein n=1 Tax=Urochloa decumbens TaxID=240449 RepID=A0ABC8X6N0_9POAL